MTSEKLDLTTKLGTEVARPDNRPEDRPDVHSVP